MDEQKTTADGQTASRPKRDKKNSVITVKADKKGRHVIKPLRALRIFVLPFYRLLKPFRFYGNHKIKDGACIYILNHYTLLDPAYAIATTREGIHFLAKKENFQAPLLGGIMRKVKAISANRDGNDARALLDCFKCLKNNEKIAIFPEGTRNKTDAPLLPFKHGAAAIAIRAKVPIVPVMIYKKPRFFRRTHILVGEPLELSEYYDRKPTEEEYVEADEKLRRVMLKLREEHTEYLQNKKKKGKRV